MITHENYIATYTVRRIGRKYLHCALHREKGKVIIDKVLINEVTKDWKWNETYTIRALHHNSPKDLGYRVAHNVIIEPQEVL